jgi:hypothetical protein
MQMWFWLNIPLALLFVGCWAGIPLWLTLTRWNAEISEKHAVIAAKARPAPVFARRTPAVAHEAGSPAYAGVARTGRERLRFLWYRLRLTISEMNYASRRMAELQAGLRSK